MPTIQYNISVRGTNSYIKQPEMDIGFSEIPYSRYLKLAEDLSQSPEHTKFGWDKSIDENRIYRGYWVSDKTVIPNTTGISFFPKIQNNEIVFEFGNIIFDYSVFINSRDKDKSGIYKIYKRGKSGPYTYIDNSDIPMDGVYSYITNSYSVPDNNFKMSIKIDKPISPKLIGAGKGLYTQEELDSAATNMSVLYKDNITSDNILAYSEKPYLKKIAGKTILHTKYFPIYPSVSVFDDSLTLITIESVDNKNGIIYIDGSYDNLNIIYGILPEIKIDTGVNINFKDSITPTNEINLLSLSEYDNQAFIIPKTIDDITFDDNRSSYSELKLSIPEEYIGYSISSDTEININGISAKNPKFYTSNSEQILYASLPNDIGLLINKIELKDGKYELPGYKTGGLSSIYGIFKNKYNDDLRLAHICFTKKVESEQSTSGSVSLQIQKEKVHKFVHLPSCASESGITIKTEDDKDVEFKFYAPDLVEIPKYRDIQTSINVSYTSVIPNSKTIYIRDKKINEDALSSVVSEYGDTLIGLYALYSREADINVYGVNYNKNEIPLGTVKINILFSDNAIKGMSAVIKNS